MSVAVGWAMGVLVGVGEGVGVTVLVGIGVTVGVLVGGGVPVGVDVADYGSVEAMVASVTQWAGGVDVLVNTAGVAEPTGRLRAFCRLLRR